MIESSRCTPPGLRPAKQALRTWEVFLGELDQSGRHHAYVCVYPTKQEGVGPSRFALRLDLPGTYLSRSDARRDAGDLLHRFFAGRFCPDAVVVALRVNDYDLKGSARFRADIHEWEPWLEITSGIGRKKRGQRFKESDSPFYSHTFASRKSAANFATWYGERMVRGAVRGLRI